VSDTLLTLPCGIYCACVSVAKSPEEIRKTFNIANDFSPEEEDQVRRENGERERERETSDLLQKK